MYPPKCFGAWLLLWKNPKRASVCCLFNLYHLSFLNLYVSSEYIYFWKIYINMYRTNMYIYKHIIYLDAGVSLKLFSDTFCDSNCGLAGCDVGGLCEEYGALHEPKNVTWTAHVRLKPSRFWTERRSAGHVWKLSIPKAPLHAWTNLVYNYK